MHSWWDSYFESRAHGPTAAQPELPDLSKHHLCFSFLTCEKQEFPSRSQLAPWCWSRTNTKQDLRERGVLPSLPWLRNQGRVNKVYQACDRHTEGACSMAGGDVVKVTVVPGGTSWLRCSASKLNTDRKPCVWYCKKIICLPARVRLANQRGCFHLKEILQQWERKEWNSGY